MHVFVLYSRRKNSACISKILLHFLLFFCVSEIPYIGMFVDEDEFLNPRPVVLPPKKEILMPSAH
jgi:hypothetical protein